MEYLSIQPHGDTIQPHSLLEHLRLLMFIQFLKLHSINGSIVTPEGDTTELPLTLGRLVF
jgi:hypothetical protein